MFSKAMTAMVVVIGTPSVQNVSTGGTQNPVSLPKAETDFEAILCIFPCPTIGNPGGLPQYYKYRQILVALIATLFCT